MTAWKSWCVQIKIDLYSSGKSHLMKCTVQTNWINKCTDQHETGKQNIKRKLQSVILKNSSAVVLTIKCKIPLQLFNNTQFSPHFWNNIFLKTSLCGCQATLFTSCEWLWRTLAHSYSSSSCTEKQNIVYCNVDDVVTVIATSSYCSVIRFCNKTVYSTLIHSITLNDSLLFVKILT